MTRARAEEIAREEFSGYHYSEFKSTLQLCVQAMQRYADEARREEREHQKAFVCDRCGEPVVRNEGGQDATAHAHNQHGAEWPYLGPWKSITRAEFERRKGEAT